MKKFPLFKIYTLIAAIVLSGVTASANTYTAVVTGSWTNTTTWGGSVPPLTVTSDQIIIPVGVNVTLDNNLVINGATASLDVEGSLIDGLTDTVALTAGAITGTGGITVSGFTLNTGTVLAFTGGLAVQTMTNYSNNIALTAHASIGSALYLAGGVLSVQGGGLVTLGQNTNIYVSGGGLSLNGGDLVLTSTYNVTYTQTAMAGVELTGTGLNNLTVNGSAGTTVTLSSDLTMSGTLNLVSGTLVLNTHNLYITGDIASTSSGTVSSGGTSNITIRTATTPSGTLNFTTGLDTVNNLTIQLGAAGSRVNMGSDVIVNGTLTFVGGMLNVGSHGLYITAGASISGADSTMYVIATDSGFLSIHMTASGSAWVSYPIGSASYYSPVALELNSGSASGNVRASLSSGVSSQGYYYNGGTDLSLSQPSVKVTYYIEPDSTMTSNINIRLMWSAALEANGLNTDSVYISHYTNSAWDVSATQAATVQGSLYTAERDNITAFSPFAVFGPGAQTSSAGVTEISARDLQIYPNPASDHLMVTNIKTGDNYTMNIIDMTGQSVATYHITQTNNTISVTGLNEGQYLVRLSNSKTTLVRKFVKL